jgi:hypothetical protein
MTAIADHKRNPKNKFSGIFNIKIQFKRFPQKIFLRFWDVALVRVNRDFSPGYSVVVWTLGRIRALGAYEDFLSL